MEPGRRAILLDFDPPLPPDEHGVCYRGDDHFIEFMNRMTRRELMLRGKVWDRVMWHPLGCLSLWIAGIVIWCLLTAAIPGLTIGGLLFVVTGMLFAPFLREGRLNRARRRLLVEQTCFTCGYPLKGAPSDEAGWSACPECGRRFHRGEYKRPPAGHVRATERDKGWLDHLEPAARREMIERLGPDYDQFAEYASPEPAPDRPPAAVAEGGDDEGQFDQRLLGDWTDHLEPRARHEMRTRLSESDDSA